MVSDDVHQQFIVLFDDKNPMHTDSAYAKSHGYADKIMHGNILNGFLSYFIGEKMPFKNVVILSQKIRFNNPIYANTEVRLSATVSGSYAEDTVYEFKFKFIDKSEKTIFAKGSIQIKRLT